MLAGNKDKPAKSWVYQETQDTLAGNSCLMHGSGRSLDCCMDLSFRAQDAPAKLKLMLILP